MLLLSEMQVLPKGFSKPSCACITNPILFQIFNIYEHYLPAYCIDVYLKMRGNKFSLVKMYKFLDRVWLKMKYFLGRTFDFKMETYNQLSKLMDPRDTEIFSLDLHEVSLHKIIQSIPEATDFFDWSQDTLAPEKRKEVLIRRARIISCLKITIIVLLVYLLHRIISLIL
nr:fatty acyl-CoA reductase 2 [Parasteatoda tepidariorum]